MSSPPPGSAQSVPAPRRDYIDWLRGLGVVIMIEAHTLDAWTSAADKTSEAYWFAMLVSGMGAPIFLFLAGMSVALASGSLVRRGATVGDAAGRMIRRGFTALMLAAPLLKDRFVGCWTLRRKGSATPATIPAGGIT
jgi:uncharacterized membrane protein